MPDQILSPVCPNCGADPLIMATMAMKIGILEMLIVYCGNPACRKAFNTHVLHVDRTVITLDSKGKQPYA